MLLPERTVGLMMWTFCQAHIFHKKLGDTHAQCINSDLVLAHFLLLYI